SALGEWNDAIFSSIEARLYARRAVSRDRDYWRVGSALAAGRAVGSRVVPPHEVRQQPQADWPGAAQLSRPGGDVSDGDVWRVHAFVAARYSARSRTGQHD